MIKKHKKQKKLKTGANKKMIKKSGPQNLQEKPDAGKQNHQILTASHAPLESPALSFDTKYKTHTLLCHPP